MVVCLTAGFLLAGAAAAAPNLPAEDLGAGFFNQLALDRPELGAVREAALRSDWAAARHALAEHMRHRRSPQWG